MGKTPPGPGHSSGAGSPGRPRRLLRAAGPGSQHRPGTDPRRAGADPGPPADEQVVSETPALHGRPGGPGIIVSPAAARWLPPGPSAWQRLERPWGAAGIAWAGHPAQRQPSPAVPGDLPWPAQVPRGEPVTAGPGPGQAAAPPAGGQPAEPWEGDVGEPGWPGVGEEWEDGEPASEGAQDALPPDAARIQRRPAWLRGAPVAAGPVPGPAAAPPAGGQPAEPWEGDVGEPGWPGVGEEWEDGEPASEGAQDALPPDAAGDLPARRSCSPRP